MILYVYHTKESGILMDNDPIPMCNRTLHNPTNSSFLIYKNDELLYEEFWYNGKLHRLNKAAVIKYSHGVVETETVEYWFRGVEYTYNDFMFIMKLKTLENEKHI